MAFSPPFILTALTASGYFLMGKENSIIYARDFLFNYGEKHFPVDYPYLNYNISGMKYCSLSLSAFKRWSRLFTFHSGSSNTGSS